MTSVTSPRLCRPYLHGMAFNALMEAHTHDRLLVVSGLGLVFDEAEARPQSVLRHAGSSQT
ncbi:MAG TPA: hypothetical protein VM782_23365, partial [Stellaceae bacterium]|nr:hypothetical protein [Stellaceae bacterium]